MIKILFIILIFIYYIKIFLLKKLETQEHSLLVELVMMKSKQF